MIRMVKECDQSQRRLAAFLIVIVTIEVTLISSIIRHEHTSARKSWREKRTQESTEKDVSVHRRKAQSPLLDKVVVFLVR